MEMLPTDVLLYPVGSHEGHMPFLISITGKEDVMTLKSIYRVKRITCTIKLNFLKLSSISVFLISISNLILNPDDSSSKYVQ